MDNFFIWTVNEILFPSEKINYIKNEFKKKLVTIIDPSIAAFPLL